MGIFSIDGGPTVGGLGKNASVGMGNGGSYGYPGRSGSTLPLASQVIFQHNIWDGSPNPTVGNYTYTRTGTVYRADSYLTLAPVSANTLPINAYRFGDAAAAPGLDLESAITNQILQSEDFTTTWSSVGGGSASADTSTSPDVSETADTISGSSAGDGLSQSSSQAAASKAGVFSVFLKASSGSPTVDIRVGDNTSSEISTTTCQLSTSWRRFEVARRFTSSASGNIKVQIIVGNSSTTRAWGAQLEVRSAALHQFRCANAYVKTTSSTATSGASSYVIPSQTISQAATKGSIAMWVNVNWDAINIMSGSAACLFSMNGATSGNLSVVFDQTTTYVYLNNVSLTLTGEGSFANRYQQPTNEEWKHYVLTWDTDADSTKLYVDGTLVLSSTTSISPVSVGSDGLRIGGYGTLSTYGVDGLVSQVVLWKDALTAAQASSVYNSKSSLYAPVDPGTGKLFEVSLGTSAVPTTATDYQYWYENRGTGIYYDSTTSCANYTDGQYVAPAYNLNGYNKGGLQFQEYRNNKILQSESPANAAWTAVGIPVVADGASTFGVISLGSIVGIAGDGIRQSSGLAAASKYVVGSVFARVSSGTLAFDIVIEGDSGGTPETITTSHTATTTLQRFVNPHNKTAFTSSATGNVRMTILIQGTGTLLLGGMQLQDLQFGDAEFSINWGAASYIKTTSSAVTLYPSLLGYKASKHFNKNKGTVLGWAAYHSDNFLDFGGQEGPTMWGSPGHSWAHWATLTGNTAGAGSGTLSYWMAGTRNISPTGGADVSKNTWYHFGWAWDFSSLPGTIEYFLNGVSLGTDTQNNPATPRQNFFIGMDGYQNGVASWFSVPLDNWKGVIDKVTIYGERKSGSFVSGEFDSSKASYGY